MQDIIRKVLKNSLIEAPAKKIKCNTNDNNLAWVFIAKKEEGPVSQKSCRTYSSLFQLISDDTIYWTPNTFYDRRFRQKDALRWLNAIVIDIDDQDMIYLDVLDRLTDAGLPAPSIINKTPHGYHVYWIFSEPVRATKKAVTLYEAIIREMVAAAGADPCAVGAERFFRIPRQVNVVYESAHEYTLQDFVDWREYEAPKQPDTSIGQVVAFRKGILNHPAVKVLLDGVSEGKRDNTAFTLALVYRFEGYNSDETIKFLLEWNKRNIPQLSYRVIQQKVKSAFSGRYHGPSANYITELSGIPFYFQPVKKNDAESKYVPLEQIKRKILSFLYNSGGKKQITQKELSSSIDAPMRSVQKALSELQSEGKIMSVQHNRGRGSKTTYSWIFPQKPVMVYHKMPNRAITKYCLFMYNLFTQTPLHLWWWMGGWVSSICLNNQPLVE